MDQPTQHDGEPSAAPGAQPSAPGDEPSVEPFFAELAAAAGTAPLTDAEAELVLDLARVVAHSKQRRLAPLTAYAAGLALGGTGEAERLERLRAVIDAVRALP